MTAAEPAALEAATDGFVPDGAALKTFFKAAAPAFACALCCASARAEPQPVWEIGAGIAAIDFAHYRGSDQRQTYVLPLPYVIYRGEILRADRDRVRGLFFESDRAELHVSVNGSIPVDSDDNEARRGMPDLDPTLEIGPSLEVELLRTGDGSIGVELRLPARTVVATDFSSFRNRGWVFQPLISVDLRDAALGPGWKASLAAGPMWGDKRYHNTYYGVPPEFATAQRPAYRAEGGYAGGQFLATASRRFQHWWVGAFARWDTLSGAVFEDSPLVRQKHSFAAGIAFTRPLKRSGRLTEIDQ
jgi:outer membrane scaffolding protein for murein synthesis (MipA/OmpV family)